MSKKVMKFSVDREALCSGLQAVGNPIAAKSAMPILGNVLLDARESTLSLSTTNLDFGIRCAVPIEAHKLGATTVSSKKLAGIARAISSATIDVELLPSQTSLKVSGAGSVFRLPCLPAGDFPALPSLDGAQRLFLSAEQLSDALRRVEYAQSTDEHRHVLNGVCAMLGSECLSFVATDGRRLAFYSIPCEGIDGTFIIPAKAVAEILRLLPGAESVDLSFSNRQVACEIAYATGKGSMPERIFLISKVVEGNYPNYRQVIPETAVHRMQVARETLLNSLQRATLVSSGTSPSVTLKFSENLLELFASSAEFGEAYERIAIIFPEPQEVQISFNPRYLIEPLRPLSEEEVAFEFRDHLSPGVFRAGGSFLCVVMPLRGGTA
ncbi:MAG: DNA polymerase III subunit beta [Puniceicoccales bacterium]|jgi:DNA polymerase-3 subunit beta|nr:DNA polymerase III subunit beta [Puniceicoccales bacterium]